MCKHINSIKYLNLGRKSYSAALQIQRDFEKEHFNQEGSAKQVLIVTEHDPVYTYGFRETIDLKEAETLRRLGSEVIQSDRGGLTTFHGPGQLVIYPILNLLKLEPKLTLKNYVAMMEKTAVHTCRLLGLPASPGTSGVSHTGAWVGNNKLCAIGIHCRKHVTTHGIALNCNVDLSWFSHIVPCGIKDKGVSSLSKELNFELTTQKALNQFLQSFQVIFNTTLEPI